MIRTLKKLERFQGAEITPDSITADLTGKKAKVNLTVQVYWTQALPRRLTEKVRAARALSTRYLIAPHPKGARTPLESVKASTAEALQSHLERKIRRRLGRKNEISVAVYLVENWKDRREMDYAGGNAQRVTAANVEKLKPTGTPIPDPYAPYDDRGGIGAREISRILFNANIQLTISKKRWERQKKRVPPWLPIASTPESRPT